MKIVLVLLFAIFMSGCANLYKHNADPNAKARDVTIIDKTSYSTIYNSAMNGMSNTIYTVQDNQNHKFIVYSKFNSYEVGSCMTLWQSRDPVSYPLYPRLTPADKNCRAIRPEQDVGDRYNYYRNSMKNYNDRYNITLDYWIGEDVDNLYDAWGAPSQQYQAHKMNYLVFSSSSSKLSASSDAYGNVSVYQNDYDCTVTFEIKNGVVNSYNWSGNACASKYD